MKFMNGAAETVAILICIYFAAVIPNEKADSIDG